MSKDLLYPLRSFHGQLHEKRLETVRELNKRKMLKSSTANTIFLVGTPVHPNIGDSAIAMAELFFLRRILPPDVQIIEVMEDVFRNHRHLLDQRIRLTGDRPILWHGGVPSYRTASCRSLAGTGADAQRCTGILLRQTHHFFPTDDLLFRYGRREKTRRRVCSVL